MPEALPIELFERLVHEADARNKLLATAIERAGECVLGHLGYRGPATWGSTAVYPDGSVSRELQIKIQHVVVPLPVSAAVDSGVVRVDFGGPGFGPDQMDELAVAATEEIAVRLRAHLCLPHAS